MGLLSKALKTAAKAAATAKDASRTKPKSQMNPLVKPRKKPVETDFDKSASQEVKDFLAAVEEKNPNQLGEFYSPVINTLKEMPIGKQGTKGENISAFLNKRAPNVESSERASFDLKLDPQRKYTREEVIDIAKGDGSEEYTISKVNPSSDPMYNEYKGMQRQYIKDKEEEYFVLTVDSTKYLDAAGTKVHFGKPETNLGHTRSSIRRETPAGGPLTQKIKDRERYILIEEMQSDVATDYGKLKKADKKSEAPTSPDVESIDNIVDQNIEIALEELEFDVDVGLTIPNSKIINAIKQAHINMHKNNINRFEAGEDLARLLKTEYGIDFKGRAEIDAVSKNAIFNSLETEDGIKYGRDSLDVDDTIDGLFDDIETEIQASKDQQKAYEQQQKGLPINPPIETRSDYVKKLILANINYAKRNDINKIVVPDYREIARQRINTFDYAMDQADDSNPTAIKNAELYNDLENGKITQDEYNIKYNKLAKEYFEGIFKKTYQDALKKVLNNLKTETKGAIKIGTRKLEYPAAGNFKGRTSTATEIDITDFDFDPETQALRFNMGGVVPPKNYAEGGVVSMNNQTQQAFALGGLKDEGGEIDEASGNRVPIGGIPANVSEGEFIFPADVVRYHGLDKMMALRQEAKMGLKQMERMGQMGNSDEATMPDDLPFEMADLIVVGGKGEPMEFSEGGFVPSYTPKFETLEIADVPMMGGNTSTGTQTPLLYEDFIKVPVVTMQEYRDANGNSIIITSVNGKATTEIPEGYTLYTPPANTAPTTTQAAIQTANNYSYQTSGGGDEGPDTPRELQIDPDYASMDNDTYFSTMERQNSFGGKAGNAAAMGIAMAMGPFGLLTMGMLQADKRRQLAAAEQRIAAETDPTKKKAYQATFAKMGGKIKEPEEENALVKFGKGFVAAVGGLFGLGNNDVEKVARVAGSAAADNTNVPAAKQAPAAAVDAGRVPAVSSEVVGAGPTALPMNTFADAPFGIKPDIRLAQLAGFAPASDRTRDILNRQLETGQLVERFMPPAPSDIQLESAQQQPSVKSEIATSAEPLSTTKDKVVPKTPPSSFQIIPPTQSLYTGVKEQKAVVPDISESASVPAPVPKDDTFPVTSQVASLSPESIQTNTQPVAQTDMQMGIDPKNIILENYTDKNNLEKYYLNAGYSGPEVRQIVNSVPVPNYYTNSPSTLGPDYPISTGKAYQAAFLDGKSRFSEPAYTTGAQTDALLGPQTDYGQRIANARGDSFIPQSNVDVAGPINTAIPTAAAQTSVPDKVPESPDATRRYGPDELSYIDDNTYRDTKRLGANADYNLQQPQTLIEQGQQAAYNARRANERAQAAIQPFISSPFTDVAATDDSMGLPTGPLPDDPRDIYSRGNVPTNIQKEGVTYGAPDRLSDSELSLGRARNVSTMPDPYTEIFDTPAFDSSTKPTETTQALGEPFAAEKTKRYDAFGDEIKEVSTDIKDFATPMDAPASKVKTKTKQSDAARTSKGTSTRKAAPTGDDRLSQANFLERALGITPAPISARRGNDGILYRTQADKREADKRQEDAKVSARNQGRAAARASGGQAAVDKFNKENADDIEKRHGGNKENSNNKIVCSAMNNAYGFGSFRNKIWLEHSKNNLTKEHQVGYHRMFLPLIHLGYNKDYKFIRKCLEHIARHRTADIYFQSKSNKRDTLGMVYRTILEPICYLVGMFPTSKDNK
jgi:hypothetical protein